MQCREGGDRVSQSERHRASQRQQKGRERKRFYQISGAFVENTYERFISAFQLHMNKFGANNATNNDKIRNLLCACKLFFITKWCSGACVRCRALSELVYMSSRLKCFQGLSYWHSGVWGRGTTWHAPVRFGSLLKTNKCFDCRFDPCFPEVWDVDDIFRYLRAISNRDVKVFLLSPSALIDLWEFLHNLRLSFVLPKQFLLVCWLLLSRSLRDVCISSRSTALVWKARKISF